MREGQLVPAIPDEGNGPWTCGNVSGAQEIHWLGAMMWRQTCTDGVTTRTFSLCHDPAHGVRVFAAGAPAARVVCCPLPLFRGAPTRAPPRMGRKAQQTHDSNP